MYVCVLVYQDLLLLFLSVFKDIKRRYDLVIVCFSFLFSFLPPRMKIRLALDWNLTQLLSDFDILPEV